MVEKALRHADWCYLIETGRVAGSGRAEQIHDSALLKRIYLGADYAAAAETTGGGIV
jgi:branched-chain amino acid transport system ATP-binding protein